MRRRRFRDSFRARRRSTNTAQRSLIRITIHLPSIARPAPSLLASLRPDPGCDLLGVFPFTVFPIEAFVMVTPINLGQLGIQRR